MGRAGPVAGGGRRGLGAGQKATQEYGVEVSCGFALGEHPSGRAIDGVVHAPHDGRKFREVCETLVVSAHGGLLMLRNEVDNGEILVLVNPETQEEQECRIVYLGDSGARGMRVGVEFLTPAPHFWGIDFDARQRSKSEREETAN